MNISKEYILNYFNDWGLNEPDHNYLKFHLTRYKFLLETIETTFAKIPNKNDLSLLDIGPSFQTFLMKECFPDVKIETLGFSYLNPPAEPPKCFVFDLNNCLTRENWPETAKYNVVVMAEVLEYLFVPPECVFEFIKSLLKPDGFFVMQVSNGLALFKRLDLLLGKKICGKIISGKENAVHLREYGLSDLILLGDKQGLRVNEWFIKNYYYNNSFFYSSLMSIAKLNKNFNEGITIIYQK